MSTPDFDPYTSPPGLRELDEREADVDETSERSDVRGRVERIDHALGVRSYAGGVAIVVALAAAIVAIVIALGARDESATKNQLQSLKTQVSQAAEEANKENVAKVDRLSRSVDQISGAVDSMQGSTAENAQQIDSIQGELSDLKGQISDLRASPDAGEAGPSGGFAPDPGRSLGDELRDALGGG